MLDKTIKSLNNSEVIKRGSYDYFVNPLTDGCPAIDSSVIDEITDLIISRYDFRKITKIVTMEAMGIPITAVLSCKLGIPYNIVRKRSYELIGEVEVDQVTGYSTSKMYINGVNSSDNLFIFDVIVSTGGTLKAVLNGLRSINASISQVCCISSQFGFKSGINSDAPNSCKTCKIDFVDNPFMKYDHEKHFEVVKEVRPKYATIRDYI